MASRKVAKVRDLGGAEIGLPQLDDLLGEAPELGLSPSVMLIYEKVRAALEDGYAGVILIGPPGTGKSMAALEIAHDIAGADSRVVNVQFHPSYQYEDFVEGFVPDEHGKFKMTPKTLLQLCNAARLDTDHRYVLLIDEISRSDVTRVFGEAVTYLEVSKRGRDFHLQSGTKTAIPTNVVVLATMNPWDRGVDELDWAIERRFAKIEVPPDGDVLAAYCENLSYPAAVQDGLLRFFKFLQDHQNPQCKIGHAYFMSSKKYDADVLRRLWDFQLSHHLRKALGRDAEEYGRINAAWKQNVEQALDRVADAILAPEAQAEAANPA